MRSSPPFALAASLPNMPSYHVSLLAGAQGPITTPVGTGFRSVNVSLRQALDLYANLRPAKCFDALADFSSLKRELVENLDIVIVRELTGGVYFGEPKTITDLGNGQKRAVDTQVYDTYEIERISRVAFELARTRKKKVSSAEKRNVMKTGVLWNET